MKESQNFWDRNAGRYDRFMRKDAAAYAQLYELLYPVLRRKMVLELAAGTGLIAKNIVSSAAHIEATDASPEMILEAKRHDHSAKLHFSVQDMFHLPYADGSFDVVIAANARHIVPEPEKALWEFRRVLKDDGVLVVPTFTHADNSFSGKLKAFFMKLAGFPLQQMDECGIPEISMGERLDSAEKHCFDGILPADLCRVCKNGGSMTWKKKSSSPACRRPCCKLFMRGRRRAEAEV